MVLDCFHVLRFSDLEQDNTGQKMEHEMLAGFDFVATMQLLVNYSRVKENCRML